jgi:3-oxoacyl-[acyl-carrier protein] reductase
MKIDLTGKSAIVTGAAHGFGRGIAVAFAQRGATVWGCDLSLDELQATGEQCRAVGGVCHVSRVDVSDASAVHAFSAEATKASGRVDILVNDAGGVLGQVGRPLETVPPEDWKAIFGANLDGAFFFSQAVAPGMKAAHHGRIINISSGAGLTWTLTGIQAYACAKAALLGLTRQLAHELGQFGITVNAIAPGFVRSNLNSERQWQAYGEAGQKALVESVALRRLGTPEDIAYGALFFASDYAGLITGQTLAIDGGR